MNWLRWRGISYAISLILILSGVTAMLMGGLQPALEFSGGSELTITSPADNSAFESAIRQADEAQEAVIIENLSFDNSNAFLQLNEISSETKAAFLQAVMNNLQQPVAEVSFHSVGPAVSRDLITKTAYAIVLGVLCILFYLWWQFKNWRYGLAGVLGMIHDSLILLGAFAWFGLWFDVKVDLLFVTALLTTLSTSVHDTIVIFDRIRDLQKQTRRGDQLAWLANTAITQTLPRSLNNSLTIIFMLVVLLLLGGDTLRWFTAALLIGIITGTYSSTFLAAPIYFDLQKRIKR